MDKDTLDLLISIGQSHAFLKLHADELRKRLSVKNVTHWNAMFSLEDSFRINEFVDAEFDNEEAISWFLEITISIEGVSVEADIRRIHADGQDVIASIANRFCVDTATASVVILETTQQLCQNRFVT